VKELTKLPWGSPDLELHRTVGASETYRSVIGIEQFVVDQDRADQRENRPVLIVEKE